MLPNLWSHLPQRSADRVSRRMPQMWCEDGDSDWQRRDEQTIFLGRLNLDSARLRRGFSFAVDRGARRFIHKIGKKLPFGPRYNRNSP